MYIRITNKGIARDVNSTVPACPLEKIFLAMDCPDQNQLFGSDPNHSKQRGSAGLV
jgi:hypothetical protein